MTQLVTHEVFVVEVHKQGLLELRDSHNSLSAFDYSWLFAMKSATPKAKRRKETRNDRRNNGVLPREVMGTIKRGVDNDDCPMTVYGCTCCV